MCARRRAVSGRLVTRLVTSAAAAGPRVGARVAAAPGPTPPNLGYNGRMRVARRFVVSGRVQGVGFRYYTQDIARREGVTGLVRNLHDGRVEVIAEGEATAVERLEQAIRQGPARARVERVEVDALAPTTGYVGFVAG
jgi:acylphosphatase